VSQAPPQPRIAFHDNARFLLIALVVVGHAVEPAQGEVPLLRHLHLGIYTFHIPLLAFLSGVFAVRARRGLLRDVTGLLVPYLVFQVLYSAASIWAGEREGSWISPLTPVFLTWYLVSLFCWRWLARIFERVPLSIPLALLVGIAAGFLDPLDYRLSLSRTVVFFPFFLIGLRAPADLPARLAGHRTAVVGAVFLALLFAQIAWWDPRLDPAWLYGGLPYSALLTGPAWVGGLVRAAIYGLALVGGLSFLCLVPTKTTFFTAWGSRSLGAYLLHGLLVKAAGALGLYELDLQRPWAQAALVTAALALAMLLSSRVAHRLTRALVGQPWLDRFVRQRAGREA